MKHSWTERRVWVAAMVLSLGLYGCGGGGGDRSPQEGVAGTEAEMVEDIDPGPALAYEPHEPLGDTSPVGELGVQGHEFTDAVQDTPVTAQSTIAFSQLRLRTWVGSFTETSDAVTAASAMTFSAWNAPTRRWRVAADNKLYYFVAANGDGAVRSCRERLEECRAGTRRLLENYNTSIRNRMSNGICPNGVRGNQLYFESNTAGRRLLAERPSVMRVVTYSTAGVMLYTGINWAADTVGPYDPTKLSLGAKQHAVWMVGTFLTAYIGADLRALSAEGLIVVQNTARRAALAAFAVMPSVVQAMQYACPSGSLFWPWASWTNSNAWDIEMGRIEP